VTAGPANHLHMEVDGVAHRVATDTDDVLATLPLVKGNTRLTDRLFEQLVDLLLEGILVDLRTNLLDGFLSNAAYGEELATLAAQCRAVGLLDRS
jgi:hypothetical protein